jgi:hypothetical protein
MAKWFDPAFQVFVDKELIPTTPIDKRRFQTEFSSHLFNLRITKYSNMT